MFLRKQLFSLLLLLLPYSICFGMKNYGKDIYSPFSAQILHQSAMTTMPAESDDPMRIRPAMLLLLGASELDDSADYLYADIIKTAGAYSIADYSGAVRVSLQNYVNSECDVGIALKGVRYLLENQEFREGREQLLSNFMSEFSDKSPALGSQLGTELGVLFSEKAAFEQSQEMLWYSYQIYPYNEFAFSQLSDIVRRNGQGLDVWLWCSHLRRMVMADPYSLDSVVKFSSYCESLELYGLAESGWSYCAKLYSYLNGDDGVRSWIYRPWSVSAYYSGNYSVILDIVRSVRDLGRFDIFIEAMGIKAARGLGNEDFVNDTVSRVESERDKVSGGVEGSVSAADLAWFYNFAEPDSDLALAWANKAYSADSESEGVIGLLAYSLAKDNTFELADEMVEGIYEQNQIAAVTKGLILLEEGEESEAIEVLKGAVGMDPASFAGERARELLESNGSGYVSGIDVDGIRSRLEEEFGEELSLVFRPINRVFSGKLNAGGNEFSYGSDFSLNLIVDNKSGGPLIIADNGFFKGFVRVDAEISGDIELKIEGLIDKRIWPCRVIGPGEHGSIGLDPMRGYLGRVLKSYAQASVDIEFKAYLDPVKGSDGNVVSSLPEFEALTYNVRRRGLRMTRELLMQRLESLSRGSIGQKVTAIELFSGLLIEKKLMGGNVLYRHVSVPRKLLLDAIRKGIGDQEWTIRLYSLSQILFLPEPFDYELVDSVSEALNDSHWPVRLMGLYVLGRGGDEEFKQVLDWSAQYDRHPLVQRMAVALGGKEPVKSDVEGIEAEK